jgi:hypothetical protein
MSRGLAPPGCGLFGETTEEPAMNRIFVIAVLAAACGGSSGSTAVDRNRAGTGSSTLRVTGNVDVTVSATAPVTNYSVTLRDGLGANVGGATVVVRSPAHGDVALVEAGTGSGNYTGSKTSYPGGDLALSVVRGTDKVQGVVVGYPGEHAINGPTLNGTVSSGQPLQVTWTTPSTAKAATITTRDFSVQAPDTGTYDIPAANNPVRPNQRVILVRSNELDVAGALPTSRMRVTVTTTVDPFTVN